MPQKEHLTFTVSDLSTDPEEIGEQLVNELDSWSSDAGISLADYEPVLADLEIAIRNRRNQVLSEIG